MIFSIFTFANVGIPFAAGAMMTSVLLLAPIILIEAGFIARQLKQRYPKSLLIAAIANLLSTLVGIVLAVFLWGIILERETLPILAIELLGSFLLTILIEFFVLHKAFNKISPAAIRKVTLVSNGVTYLLLICVSIGLFLVIDAPDTRRMKRNRTMADMRSIGTAVESYQIDYGFYPLSTGAWKNELVGDQYYRGAAQDAWEQPFQYLSDGKDYTLGSYGKDQRVGSGKDAFDSDIVFLNGRFVAPSAVVER